MRFSQKLREDLVEVLVRSFCRMFSSPFGPLAAVVTGFEAPRGCWVGFLADLVTPRIFDWKRQTETSSQ